FVTAAAPKAATGWLSPATQAVQGTLFRHYYVLGDTDWLAADFLSIHSRLFWESLDWATILLEGGLVLTIVHWRAWRIGLAVTTLFHLGVFLMVNIAFIVNLAVYGAFVRWSTVLRPALPAGAAAWLARWRHPVVL